MLVDGVASIASLLSVLSDNENPQDAVMDELRQLVISRRVETDFVI